MFQSFVLFSNEECANRSHSCYLQSFKGQTHAWLPHSPWRVVHAGSLSEQRADRSPRVGTFAETLVSAAQIDRFDLRDGKRRLDMSKGFQYEMLS